MAFKTSRLSTLFAEALFHMRADAVRVYPAPFEHVGDDYSSFDCSYFAPCRTVISRVTSDKVVQPAECQNRAHCPTCLRCLNHCDCLGRSSRP